MNLETPESTMNYQLGLTGPQYNIAVSVFFIGYVLAELPSNLLLTRVKPSIQISRICVAWGIVSLISAVRVRRSRTDPEPLLWRHVAFAIPKPPSPFTNVTPECATLMGATFNFGSLVACRIFLGLFQGGLAPGIIFYLGFWYKKYERASRWAVIYVGAGIAGAFSGIIAYGVAGMNVGSAKPVSMSFQILIRRLHRASEVSPVGAGSLFSKVSPPFSPVLLPSG
jgi:MFS family permease